MVELVRNGSSVKQVTGGDRNLQARVYYAIRKLRPNGKNEPKVYVRKKQDFRSRNFGIVRARLLGASLPALAALHGVSRQRIEQIIAREAPWLPRFIRMKRLFLVVRAVRRAKGKLSAVKIAHSIYGSPSTVSSVASALKVPLRGRRKYLFTDEQAQRVRDGESLYSVAGKRPGVAAALGRHVAELGIVLISRSRRRDYTHRRGMILDMLRERRTWQEITDAVNDREPGKRIGKASLMQWAYNNRVLPGRRKDKDG